MKILDAYKEAKEARCAKVVDLGCSYGVNAALLKYGMDLEDLYGLYGTDNVDCLDRSDLIERDRKIFAHEDAHNSIEVVGVDAAPRALAYAEEAGIIDEKVIADLEQEELNAEGRKVLGDADLVISTGCVGYISEKTITKIVEANRSRQPWMAHFVLRMFPFQPIKDALSDMGYVTARGAQPVRQRRFVSDQEQEQVLERLTDMGIDASGFETEGWYYADLHLSRPVSDTALVPCSKLISG